MGEGAKTATPSKAGGEEGCQQEDQLAKTLFEVAESRVQDFFDAAEFGAPGFLEVVNAIDSQVRKTRVEIIKA